MSPDRVVTIRRGVTRLARRLRVERPPSALSANKIAVLAALYRSGPSTPGAIAAAEHQQPQSLTRVFADLEADGLVLRVRSETDRRAWVLHLTDAGRDALHSDMAQRDAWLAVALDDLTEAERGLLEVAAGLLEDLARR
ncbi:MarR family winged helix-turn-helix transcriptional regulator [Cryptosporangium sp. NPDC051539]|uniref:MarR family winged helix-turn-helix transcriptional regulator n=1 Tax=Cryptosporangium sp. NPDC051539 TaxID=3363962 RepID=UPI00378A127A